MALTSLSGVACPSAASNFSWNNNDFKRLESSQKLAARRCVSCNLPGKGGVQVLAGKSEAMQRRVSAKRNTWCASVSAKDPGNRPIDKSDTLSEDPYGPVWEAMSGSVVTTTPDAMVSEVLPHFEHFTGLPVVDPEGHCVGIISNIDVYKHLQRGKNGELESTRVSEVMTSPAYCIRDKAPIAYAAGLMLQNKIHRLPVIDANGVVIGILTRTDIYEPLMPKLNPMYARLMGKTEPPPNFLQFTDVA